MAEEFGSSQKKPSRLWYLLPIFFGIVGGIAAYLLVQDKDKKFARKLLIVGIVLTVVYIVIPLLIGLISIQYFWSNPLAEKRQATLNYQKLCSAWNETGCSGNPSDELCKAAVGHIATQFFPLNTQKCSDVSSDSIQILRQACCGK